MVNGLLMDMVNLLMKMINRRLWRGREAECASGELCEGQLHQRRRRIGGEPAQRYGDAVWDFLRRQQQARNRDARGKDQVFLAAQEKNGDRQQTAEGGDIQEKINQGRLETEPNRTCRKEFCVTASHDIHCEKAEASSKYQHSSCHMQACLGCVEAG